MELRCVPLYVNGWRTQKAIFAIIELNSRARRVVPIICFELSQWRLDFIANISRIALVGPSPTDWVIKARTPCSTWNHLNPLDRTHSMGTTSWFHLLVNLILCPHTSKPSWFSLCETSLLCEAEMMEMVRPAALWHPSSSEIAASKILLTWSKMKNPFLSMLGENGVKHNIRHEFPALIISICIIVKATSVKVHPKRIEQENQKITSSIQSSQLGMMVKVHDSL